MSTSGCTPRQEGAATTFYRLLLGDARQVLAELLADSIDLVITSPPYADARASSYSGC